MNQTPRRTATAGSAASNLRTNPVQTNNQRDLSSDSSNASLPIRERGGQAATEDDGDERTGLQQKDAGKINQVIQQFHTKAALVIVSSRVPLPPAYTKDGTPRIARWFNTHLDDSDALLNDLQDWRTFDIKEERPAPLVVEIYIDTDDIPNNKTLVVVDDRGKRLNVNDALRPQSPSGASNVGRGSKRAQLVLERWTIEVGNPATLTEVQLKEMLPSIYKKCIVLFRSLVTYTKILPAFRLQRKSSRHPASQNSLKLRYRIFDGYERVTRHDTLKVPLYYSTEPVTQDYVFAPVATPYGPLNIAVSYRVNCDLRVDDAESLLSSQFMGLDDDYFRPSLDSASRQPGKEPGSVPIRPDYLQRHPDRSHAYGSLSTFHQVGPATGTSPISALRALRDNSATSPPSSSPPQKMPPNVRSPPGTRPPLRSTESAVPMQRRTSVSFQPFKAGSLSSSPQIPTSLGSSVPRSAGLGTSTHAKRASLTAIPQLSPGSPLAVNEAAVASSSSSSPKPAPISRYSSSFSNRRNRFPSTSLSTKPEEDATSSGKQSLSSSAQPGSGLLQEGEEGASSGSAQTDEENISDFLKLLEQKKELKSIHRANPNSREASTRRTTAALSKYQRMRDSNAALSDSLSSSHLLHRSSSSSSRQLTSVPPMVAGTSASTSSSPGKPISPHTPHTPAVPSRLSANSIVDYTAADTDALAARGRSRSTTLTEVPRSDAEDGDATNTLPPPGAIDIPTSPRPTYSHIRRSSSVAQQPGRQHPQIEEDDETGGLPFSLRATSLDARGERPDLNVADLLRSRAAGGHSAGAGVSTQIPDVLAQARESLERESPLRPASTGIPVAYPSVASRGHRSSRSRGSSGGGSTSGTSRVTARLNPTVQALAREEEDEPLLFAMSDFGVGRRSVDEPDEGSSRKGQRGKSSTWGK